MPKTDAYVNEMFAHEFENADIATIGDATGLRGASTAGSLYVALHTDGDGLRAGNQSTDEVSYGTGGGTYARQPIARSTAGFTTSSRQTVNDAALVFPTNNSGDTEARFWSIGAAVSGASKIVRFGHFGDAVKPAIALDTSDLITCRAHGFSAGYEVVFWATPGQSIPTGLTEGVVYFVIATGLATDEFSVSATAGGAAVNITAAGACAVGRVTALDINATPNTTPRIEIGQLQITE